MANSDKLVDGGHATDNCMVADFAVPGNCRQVGQGHTISDDAVVGDMRTPHDETIIADTGSSARAISADMHGDTLANDAIPANRQCRVTAPMGTILRCSAQRRMRSDFGAITNGRGALYAHVA